jgi:anaerobic magnesium-protoporphyrin IX monomethyl ester cyclase
MGAAGMKIVLAFTELNQKFGPLGFQHGLASISAVLKQHGFTDITLAHFTEPAHMERWEAELARLKPDLVGFYSTAEQFYYVKDLVQRVPPGIFTIVGGAHPTCFPDCIEKVPRLDAICVGEGEFAMLELVQALQAGQDPGGIRSLWVRRNGTIVRNPVRPFIEDLDALPYEDLELFNPQAQIDKYGMSQIRMITSRGCPYQCTYCSNKRQSESQPGRYVRYRGAAHVMGELNALNRQYRFNEVMFDDDIFMMNKAILAEFCERYPKEIGKPFVFCGRVEMCKPDMLRALKAAGGRRIDFGVESGNEELRRSILKRRMTNAMILDACRMAQAAGLQVKTLNMVGLPDETVAQHLDTVRINQAISPDVVSIFTFCPYPGTELYDYCVAKGYYTPTDELPKGYVARRDTLLAMPSFPKRDIERCFKRFGFRVYRQQSLVKAIGYTVIQSKHGELILALTKPFRKVLRKMLKGF